MKKVFQTIVGSGNGNCVAACVASILDKNLEEVPPLLPDDAQMKNLIDFMLECGYKYEGSLYNKNYWILQHPNSIYCFESFEWYEPQILSKEKLQELSGIDGLFLAVVYSPKFSNFQTDERGTHQVIIDKDLNIVHDPNEGYKDLVRYPLAELLEFNGIIYVEIFEKVQE